MTFKENYRFMNKYKTLASNMVVMAIGQLSSKLLVYVMLKFYQNELGTAGYGQMGNIVYACDLLISVVSLSMSNGVLRFSLEKENDGRMVFSTAINIALASSAAFALFTPLIGLIPMLKGYQWLIYVYVVLAVFKDICSLYIKSKVSVVLFSLDGIITTVVTVLCNLVLLGVFHFGVAGYVFSIILGNVASLFFTHITGRLYAVYHPLRTNRELRLTMLRYCVPLIPTMIMWWIVSASDSFMVTSFISDDANGIYQFAYKFPNLIVLVLGIFMQAWRMSAITERNSRTVSNFYSNIFDMLQTLMFLAAGGIMLILHPIIMPLFAGDGFDSAYFYVPILLGATVFQSFDSFLSTIYEAAQKTTHSLISSVIGAAANVVLNLILIPLIGVSGAAIATLISYLVVFIYRIIDTRKYLYMTIYWAKININLALLCVMGWATMFLERDVPQCIINSAVFLIIVFLNVRSCIQAVKLILNKDKNRAPQPAHGAAGNQSGRSAGASRSERYSGGSSPKK